MQEDVLFVANLQIAWNMLQMDANARSMMVILTQNVDICPLLPELLQCCGGPVSHVAPRPPGSKIVACSFQCSCSGSQMLKQLL